MARPWGDEATPDGTVPRLSAETKVPRAFADPVSGVVELLDYLPVVTTREALIDSSADASSVVGDGALGDIKPAGDLDLA
jgi:hypothetical protein